MLRLPPLLLMIALKNIKLWSAAFLLIIQIDKALAQCLPTGATVPSTITNNPLTGSVSWSNLLNGLTSNGAFASCGTLLGVLGSAQTNYIAAWNYGFAVPTTATVCGIEVRIERNAAGLLIGSSITDKNLYLMNAGTPVGNNYASATGWSGTNTIAVYGSNSDLWGTTWTPAQINAPNFGVALSAEMKAGLASLFLSANVDAVSITVYYTGSPLPVELVSFSGIQESQTIKLQWQTASEKDNAYFEVEKMNDDFIWQTMEKVPGLGNTSVINSYSAYDYVPSPISYYRLKQVDNSHQPNYSQIISVDYVPELSKELLLYPSPVTDVLHASCSSVIEKAEVISGNGDVSEQDIPVGETIQLNMTSFPEGLYLLKVYTKKEVLIKRFIKS